MKNQMILAAAVALGVITASVPAMAEVYYWSYTLENGEGSGSGTFFAGPATSLPTAITSATGTIWSDPDLGGPLVVTGISSYAFSDNLIYALGFENGNVSFAGISLALSDGESINISTDPGNGPRHAFILNSLTNPDGNESEPTYFASYSINAVPEPSTWAMMALGFAGLGFLGYRKTRSDNALA
jgi:hypothetical protein